MEIEGKDHIDSLKNRIADIEKKAAGLKTKLPAPPSIACIEWIEPLMAAGNWVPELVEIAGGRL